MARMVRKQVYIEPEQEEMLKRQSRELGITESELIRRGIEQLAQGAGSRVIDKQAWEEELAFIKERASLAALGRARGWTREESYGERLSRISR